MILLKYDRFCHSWLRSLQRLPVSGTKAIYSPYHNSSLSNNPFLTTSDGISFSPLPVLLASTLFSSLWLSSTSCKSLPELHGVGLNVWSVHLQHLQALPSRLIWASTQILISQAWIFYKTACPFTHSVLFILHSANCIQHFDLYFCHLPLKSLWRITLSHNKLYWINS